MSRLDHLKLCQAGLDAEIERLEGEEEARRFPPKTIIDVRGPAITPSPYDAGRRR